jgi:hypothetical protein
MDVAGIEPGRDFRKAIDQSVATCTVVLAVIGQEWLDLRDSQGGRRLDAIYRWCPCWCAERRCPRRDSFLTT